MEDIRIDSLVKFVNLFENTKVLGSGKEGTCYKKGNRTYKLYKSLYCNLYNNDIAIKRLLKFRDLLVDNVYFIRSLIYVDGDMVGSVSDYASGMNCGKVQLHRRNLDKLILALSTLKKNVYELSELGIYIEDEFLPNMLYDGKVFKFIDTGGYYYSSEILDYEVEEDKDDVLVIYRKNMKKVMNLLYGNITNINTINDDFIFAFLWYADSPYKTYLVDTDLMINPDEAIIGIRNTIQEYVGHEIDTFSSCRNELLRIRKRR